MHDGATFLDLGDRFSIVWSQSDGQRRSNSTLPMGVGLLAEQCFGHAPPTPDELEHAIEATEELVMPLARQYGGNQALTVTGIGATLVSPGLSGAALPTDPITLDDLEALFNRLVAVSQGRPVTSESLPMDRRFFAAVLILREFMHHLGLQKLNLQVS